MKFEAEKCIFPKCERMARTRTLCATHYMTAAKLVQRGKTTWEQLEKTGKVGRTKNRPKRDNTAYFLTP